MISAMDRAPTRLLAYCLMPNHWHMVLWPRKDGEMIQFLRWLTITHSQRLHAHRHTTGYGHIEQDESLLNVLRYVERNALRAKLVEPAQDWRWCSLWRRLNGDRESLLSSWPLDTPADWIDWVNGAQTAGELDALRKSVNRGTPYGSKDWAMRIANVLRLEFTLHPCGRPRREKPLNIRKGLCPLFFPLQYSKVRLDVFFAVELFGEAEASHSCGGAATRSSSDKFA